MLPSFSCGERCYSEKKEWDSFLEVLWFHLLDDALLGSIYRSLLIQAHVDPPVRFLFNHIRFLRWFWIDGIDSVRQNCQFLSVGLFFCGRMFYGELVGNLNEGGRINVFLRTQEFENLDLISYDFGIYRNNRFLLFKYYVKNTKHSQMNSMELSSMHLTIKASVVFRILLTCLSTSSQLYFTCPSQLSVLVEEATLLWGY